jgi:hypothetical protein
MDYGINGIFKKWFSLEVEGCPDQYFEDSDEEGVAYV